MGIWPPTAQGGASRLGRTRTVLSLGVNCEHALRHPFSADVRLVPERRSACSSRSIKKEDDSSQSSTCVVDTTTRGCSEEAAAWRGLHPGLSREEGGSLGAWGLHHLFSLYRKTPQGGPLVAEDG